MKCSTHGCDAERYQSKGRRSKFCSRCRTANRGPKMDGKYYVAEFRPPIPDGACMLWRDGCEQPALPGDVLCEGCAAYYRKTMKGSGYGETDEQSSRNALARMRFAEVDSCG